MAQLLTELWALMTDRTRGQAIHVFITIVGVLGTAAGVYWTNQLTIERFMARFEEKMGAQSVRIDRLERAANESGTDRLALERRLAGMEVSQNTMLNALKDMRDDLRAARSGKP